MNKNLKCARCAAVTLAVLGTLTLSACMTSTPNWDKHFGQAVTTVTRSQIINPDAPAGLPSLTGTDGKTAVAAMTNYERSLIRLRPANTGAAGGMDFGAGGYGGMGMAGGAGTR
ncbi:hypothetical protein [Cupriavidus sp. YAF13]|uniref:hypothetical protein n=1 Tax=Cupriavidus sp. YAF13 TaxID=3233075 RepID=UPI003F8F1312